MVNFISFAGNASDVGFTLVLKPRSDVTQSPEQWMFGEGGILL